MINGYGRTFLRPVGYPALMLTGLVTGAFGFVSGQRAPEEDGPVEKFMSLLTDPLRKGLGPVALVMGMALAPFGAEALRPSEQPLSLNNLFSLLTSPEQGAITAPDEPEPDPDAKAVAAYQVAQSMGAMGGFALFALLAQEEDVSDDPTAPNLYSMFYRLGGRAISDEQIYERTQEIVASETAFKPADPTHQVTSDEKAATAQRQLGAEEQAREESVLRYNSALCTASWFHQLELNDYLAERRRARTPTPKASFANNQQPRAPGLIFSVLKTANGPTMLSIVPTLLKPMLRTLAPQLTMGKKA